VLKKLVFAVVALGCLGLAGFGLLAWQPAIGPVAPPAAAQANFQSRPSTAGQQQIAFRSDLVLSLFAHPPRLPSACAKRKSCTSSNRVKALASEFATIC
jgi:hypothetical protein